MNDDDNLEKLYRIVDRLNNRFPNGNDPFQIITRLCEEAGELAKEVNHFQGTGVKVQKHGAPNRAKLAKEVQDVLCAALNVARYYDIEDELRLSIDKYYEKLVLEEKMN
jgi:NTP pyrophosphatase (non-canonical NTP hydrolase)